MSAIAGLVRLDGSPVEKGEVWAMIETMSHRGEDGTGVWTNGPIGLGHRMRHTTQESLREHLPLTSADGTLTITADARVDNRAELVAALGVPETLTDSELILRAYAVWREACVDRFVGDFAFAIWDDSARQLFCARDHFGVKSLYYHHRAGGHFAFGTEIKALHTLAEVPRRLNEVRIADHLAFMREDAESTIYEEVFRLPAAHTLIVSERGVRLERYYTLAPAVLPEIPDDADQETRDAAYDAQFRALFEEAVRCRLRSAFPIGSQLSGGLDSSAVTCVARDLLRAEGRGPLHTFSLYFDTVQSCDEGAYVEAVVEQGGIVPHGVDGEAAGPLSNVEEVYALLDDGLIGGTQHLVWELLRAAGEAGTRVVLDGIDGDNVVSHGLLYLDELADAGEWEALRREIDALVPRFRGADHLHNFEEPLGSPSALFSRYAGKRLARLADEGPWWRYVAEVRAVCRHFEVSPRKLLLWKWRKLVVPRSLARVRRAWRARRQEPIRPEIPPMVDPAFAARIGLADRLARFETAEQAKAATVREFQRVLMTSPRLTLALETTDHVAAMLGVELRHPFIDKRLIEFCLALPPEQSLRNGWTRLILRRALRHTLPEVIAERPGKAWMEPAFVRGLFGLDGALLRRQVEDLGPLASFVNSSYLEKQYDRDGDLDGIQSAELARIATFAIWLKSLRAAGPPSEGVSQGFHVSETP